MMNSQAIVLLLVVLAFSLAGLLFNLSSSRLSEDVDVHRGIDAESLQELQHLYDLKYVGEDDEDGTSALPSNAKASRSKRKKKGKNGKQTAVDPNEEKPSTGVPYSCRDIKLRSSKAKSAEYFIKPPGYNGQKFRVYCDMETDGGGWTLVSTQAPDGGLSSSMPLPRNGVGVTLKHPPQNQRYSNDVYDALAKLSTHGYQVMAEENRGPDKDQALVVVYKLPPTRPLRFGGASAPVVPNGQEFEWLTAEGYRKVKSMIDANSFGISTRDDGFNGLPAHLRCIKKTDFTDTKLNAMKTDYHMDFAGSVSGTTRCSHNVHSIGLSHWLRERGPIGGKSISKPKHKRKSKKKKRQKKKKGAK